MSETEIPCHRIPPSQFPILKRLLSQFPDRKCPEQSTYKVILQYRDASLWFRQLRSKCRFGVKYWRVVDCHDGDVNLGSSIAYVSTGHCIAGP
eukprot:2141298-Rhodomonas_salina.2